MVLGKACDSEAPLDNRTEGKKGKRSGESELQPLIYPLVQITLGAIKCVHYLLYARIFLITAPRTYRLGSGMAHYPMHLHLIRSLLHLIRHTKTYIPLAPFILPIISSPLSPTTKYHASTLKPLDLTTQIHIPSGYLKTRPLAESIVEEGVFILGEWLECMQRSIAFPELVIPVLFNLRRTTKKSKGGKGVMIVKSLLERIEEGCKWTEQRRASVKFGPGDRREVDSWEAEVDVTETPVGRWVKVQRKARASKDEMRRKVGHCLMWELISADRLSIPF
jgi:nucleolar complex protein 2